MAMVAGAIAALVGAGIWTAVGYYGNIEIGWIAWGIGAFVGAAIFVASGKQGDFALGILAVMFALVGILLGKFGVAYFAISSFANSDEPYISAIADQVMYERARNGENWPPIPDAVFDNAETLEEVYPRPIWADARNRWNVMTEAEREDLRAVPMLANPDYHIVYLADQLVDEYMNAGKPVNWPPGMFIDMAFYQEDYPEDLWADAVSRWEAMSASQRDQYVADMIASERQRMEGVKMLWQAEGTTAAFLGTFSPFDALWGILAVLSAYKLASARDEQSAATA